jgi:hypothetical protein
MSSLSEGRGWPGASSPASIRARALGDLLVWILRFVQFRFNGGQVLFWVDCVDRGAAHSAPRVDVPTVGRTSRQGQAAAGVGV